jgi:predicted TIM-barrel fold metal-dependent hydrolase
MRLFDFSLLFGADPRSAATCTDADLFRYLDESYAGGLVASLAGAYYDFLAGNAETLAFAGADKRLLPAFTLDPRRVDAREVDLKAAAQGFRALALFPAIQRWSLSHPAVEGIVARAAEARLPIVLHVPRSESAASVRCIAQSVDVPVIVVGIAYGSLGDVVAGAQAAPNLLFGMSLFVGLDNVETLVKRVGAERLVFDSSEPHFSHAPGLALLEMADISDADRSAIAIGNARRIFGGAQ